MFRTVNKVKCLNERRCYVLADVIIFVYEVPCIFWRYINVDKVSCLLSKRYYKVRWNYYKLRRVLQSAMDLLQIATGITKCDDYYNLRQYTGSPGYFWNTTPGFPRKPRIYVPFQAFQSQK